jgi:hypothetical protein
MDDAALAGAVRVLSEKFVVFLETGTVPEGNERRTSHAHHEGGL